MKFLPVFLALFALTAAADEAKVTCNIQTLADATACLEREAAALEEYEEPNDGFASERRDLLAKLFEAFGLRQKTVEEAQQADFVGFVLVHGDEHELLYYTMKKGQDVKPQRLYDLNVADIPYTIEKDARLPKPQDFFLGAETSVYDAYEDVKEALDSMEEVQDD